MIKKMDNTRETIIYKTLKGIRVFHNHSEFSYPLHWHTGLEIIMPYKHHYELQIGNIKCLLNEGDIIIIPPGELHQISPVETGGERHIMQIDYDTLLNIPGLDTLISLCHPFQIIKKEEDSQISTILYNYLHQIEILYFKRKPFCEITIYSLLLQFFDVLVNSNLITVTLRPNNKTKKQKSHADKIISACDYINTHFTDEITSEKLAEDSKLCHTHFCRIFKEFTGESINNYLTRKRLSYAKNLLLLPELTITEIIMQSGFNSISTFNRVFRSVHGCSPTEFRNLIHNMTL